MSGIETREIVCEGGLPAFVALPPGGGRAPVLLLLHERYGLVEHTRDLARRHARDGFVCVAADYFFRHPDQAALHRGASTYAMGDAEALGYMNAALGALASEPRADLDRIVAMGVCQTARHAIVLAAHHPLKAALVWYGAAQDREWQVNERFSVGLEELIGRMDCPVLGLFGEADHNISVDHVRNLRDRLEAKGKSFHIEIFGGAPHGWLNDTMPGRYRRAQAEAAWAVQRDFLAAALDGARQRTFIRQTFRAEISPTYDFSKNVRFE